MEEMLDKVKGAFDELQHSSERIYNALREFRCYFAGCDIQRGRD